MLKLQLWSTKVILGHPNPVSKFKLNLVLLWLKISWLSNIDGHAIYFCDEATRIARPDTKNKHRPVVGMPVISVKIGIIVIMACVIWVLVQVQYLEVV